MVINKEGVPSALALPCEERLGAGAAEGSCVPVSWGVNGWCLQSPLEEGQDYSRGSPESC